MSMHDGGGQLTLRPDLPFDGVKIFSATLFADRGRLGEKAITVFYREGGHV